VLFCDEIRENRRIGWGQAFETSPHPGGVGFWGPRGGGGSYEQDTPLEQGFELRVQS